MDFRSESGAHYAPVQTACDGLICVSLGRSAANPSGSNKTLSSGRNPFHWWRPVDRKGLICWPTSAQRLFPRARFTHTEQDVHLSSAQFVCCPVPPLLTLPGPAGQLLFGYSSAGWDNHSGHEGWCITTSAHCVSKVRHHLITLSSSWHGYE